MSHTISFHLAASVLAADLHDESDSTEIALRVENRNGNQVLEVDKYVHGLARRLFGSSAAEDRPTLLGATATSECLKSWFGEKRIRRIAADYEFEVDRKLSGEQAWTRGDIARLFVGVADLRKADIDEYLDLHKEERLDTIEDFQRIRARLIPFTDIKHVFLNNVPKISLPAKAPNGGRGYYSHRERVLLAWELEEFRKQTADWKEEALTTIRERAASELTIWNTDLERQASEMIDHMIELRYLVRYLKRTIDREPPKGTIVPTSKGYFVVHDVLTSGTGLSAPLLKPLVGRDLRPIVSCQGTRSHVNSTDGISTWIEDLEPKLAENSWSGHQALERLKSYLDDPSLGFVRSADQKVDVWGMSLGGAQAQRAVAEIAKRVNSLVTLCSTFIDTSAVSAFQDELKKEASIWFESTVIHHVDDVVHRVMDQHLALACLKEGLPVELIGMRSVGEEGDINSREIFVDSAVASFFDTEEASKLLEAELSYPNGVVAAGRGFFTALAMHHSEETTARRYVYSHHSSNTIEDHKLLMRELDHTGDHPRQVGARRWEEMRLGLGHIGSALTNVRSAMRWISPFVLKDALGVSGDEGTETDK